MQLHLDEIAKRVTPGAAALLILDQAGWHGAKDIKLPRNISLLPLPLRALELNGQENILAVHQAELAFEPYRQNPSTISSITAAMPGTHLSTNRGKSCQYRPTVENHVNRAT